MLMMAAELIAPPPLFQGGGWLQLRDEVGVKFCENFRVVLLHAYPVDTQAYLC